MTVEKPKVSKHRWGRAIIIPITSAEDISDCTFKMIWECGDQSGEWNATYTNHATEGPAATYTPAEGDTRPGGVVSIWVGITGSGFYDEPGPTYIEFTDVPEVS